MDIKPCYACGKRSPEIVFHESNYVFKCTECGCATKPHAFEETVKNWNDGVIYPRDKYWKMLFEKSGTL